MSNTISLQHRHYIGTAAEIGGITGVCGDTAYSTDTDIYYSWSGSAWLAGGEPYFVERLIGASDKQVGDFVTDGTWKVNGLDLSAIVPPGAIAVRIRLLVNDDAANSVVSLMRDAVNVENFMSVKTHVANIPDSKTEEISIDTDRLLDYNGSNVAFVTINLTVLGWWMRRCL